MWGVITAGYFDAWFLTQDDSLRESVYEVMGISEKF